MNKPNIKPIKAEITVVFKTCNLINSDELTIKYQNNIEKAVKDILLNYPLIEIIENEGVILNIRESED